MHFIFKPQIGISVTLGTVVLSASMLLTLVCAVRPIGLCRIVSCCDMSHCIVSYCIVSYCVVSSCDMSHCIVSYCVVL
jgi:hypothetical protein